MTVKILKALIAIISFTALSGLVIAKDLPRDLRILVDISSEVRNSQPNKQYLDALHMFVEQLPEGSNAGVWTYGKYVNYLVQQKGVDLAWREQAIKSISSIRSVASKRNIGSVLKKASFDLKFKPQDTRVILLISAGNADIAETPEANLAEQNRIKSEMLPTLREAGFRIHTIALSPQSDNSLLQSLAKETGGFSFVLDEPEEIYQVLSQVAQWMQPVNSLPVQGQQFAVDANLDQLSVQLRHEPGIRPSLTSPSGGEVTQTSAASNPIINWSQGKRFALVKIAEPELGQWKVSKDSRPDSQVLVQNLPSIFLEDLKDNYIAGENLKLRVGIQGKVAPENKPRVSVEITGEQNFSYELENDPDNDHFYGAEVNGYYQPGIYQLEVKAEALNYSRSLKRHFQVFELLNVEVKKQPDEDERGNDFLIHITPIDQDLDVDNSTVVATVTDASGEWHVNSVSLNDANEWELLIKDDGISTEYQVKLDFKGVSVSGRELHYQPKPLIIEVPRKVVVTEKELPAPVDEPPVSGALENQTVAEPEPEVVEGPKQRPKVLVTIALICIGLSILLVLFYLFMRFYKRSTKEESVEETSISEPAEPIAETKEKVEIPIVKPLEEQQEVSEEEELEEEEDDLEVELNFADEPEVEQADQQEHEDDSTEQDAGVETENDNEEQPDEDPGVEVELDLEADDPEATSEDGEVDVELNLAETEEDAVEVEFDLEEDEGVELASEWSELDAESNIERDPDEDAGDVEIEFDFDDGAQDDPDESDKRSRE